jgi:hypothetical protein
MATISKVLIGNMALAEVGVGSIESFDEDSAEAAEVKRWYDYSRLQVLEAYNWTFARARLTLALHGDAAPSGIWTFRYQTPSDYVAMRSLENPVAKTADAVPFELETSLDKSQTTIVTDLEDAVAVYTFDNEAIAMFSPHFVMTLAYQLAAHLAMPLTEKRIIKGDMLGLYREAIRIAPAHDANQGATAPPREAEWIRGRD